MSLLLVDHRFVNMNTWSPLTSLCTVFKSLLMHRHFIQEENNRTKSSWYNIHSFRKTLCQGHFLNQLMQLLFSDSSFWSWHLFILLVLLQLWKKVPDRELVHILQRLLAPAPPFHLLYTDFFILDSYNGWITF